MGVDYHFLGCIGWRIDYEKCVKWLEKNGFAFKGDRNYDDLPYFDEVGPAVAKLLKCKVEESGESEGATFVCLCVNKPFAGHSPMEADGSKLYKTIQAAAEAEISAECADLEKKRVEDPAMHAKLLTRWGQKLEEVQTRAQELGLKLPKPRIFLDEFRY